MLLFLQTACLLLILACLGWLLWRQWILGQLDHAARDVNQTVVLTAISEHSTASSARLTELNARLTALHDDQRNFLQWLQTEQQKKDQEQDKLWTGVFLPSDEAAAQIEKQLHDSEGHALSARDPILFSSRPSAPSAGKSRREPSTRAARPSGRPWSS